MNQNRARKLVSGGPKFGTKCKRCGERILMVKNGSRWKALSIPLYPGDGFKAHSGINCGSPMTGSVPDVTLEDRGPEGWPSWFILDEESVKDESVWDAANIHQLTDIGIDFFLESFDEYTGDNWSHDFWLAEVHKRFIESCLTNGTLSEERRRLLADRMFQVLQRAELEEWDRFQILFSFYPDYVFEERSGERSPKREFFDEVICWSEQYEGDGLLGIYARAIRNLESGDWRYASDLIIEEINSEELNDDALSVNMLMNILCHTFEFFAFEWGRTGVSPSHLDTVDSIRSIVNTDLEWAH